MYLICWDDCWSCCSYFLPYPCCLYGLVLVAWRCSFHSWAQLGLQEKTRLFYLLRANVARWLPIRTISLIWKGKLPQPFVSGCCGIIAIHFMIMNFLLWCFPRKWRSSWHFAILFSWKLQISACKRACAYQKSSYLRDGLFHYGTTARSGKSYSLETSCDHPSSF